MSALQTLRQISTGLNTAQQQASSGLRVASASDNAAYWSISTSMRSDKSAVSAAKDALNLGASAVDVAYSAMVQTADVLSKIRSKLVAAEEDGVDKSKIQDEISQLAQSTVGIAASASFNGVNWLNTDVHDLYEAMPEDRSANVVSSFVRNSDGTVNVNTIAFDQILSSLFNKEGGGILQGDPRSPLTIGGLRYENSFTTDITNDYLPDNTVPGSHATLPESMPYQVVGGSRIVNSISFSATDKITFDVTLDGDNPAQGLTAPLDPGVTKGVTIDQALVMSAIGKSYISDATEMSQVLNLAFYNAGISGQVSASPVWYDPPNAPPYPDPILYAITSTENTGLNGSQVQISNFSSSVASGSITDANDYGDLGSVMKLDFTPFKIYRDVSVNFTFGVNGESTESHVIDRNTVDTILGTTDGWINTPDDMVKILQTLITRPNTIIETDGSQILVRSDPLDDRLNGAKTQIGFTGMSVNIEPIPMMGLLDIDIEKHPGMVNAYLYTVNTMMQRVTEGAAALGSLADRIDMQTKFADALVDQISSGVGRLVDADMEDTSSRLAALQTQRQLAVQGLSIANSGPQSILSLFQS